MESCITLYTQAHGSKIAKKFIPSNKARNVRILSFTGGIGRVCIMKRNCKKIDIKLPQEVINPDVVVDSEDIDGPHIHIDGAQLDVMALSYVQKVYTYIYNNPHIDENIKSQVSFDTVINGIPEVYSNCDVHCFPHSPRRDITQIQDEPFVSTRPLEDKLYQLHPNPHEECAFKHECSMDSDLCEVLDKSNQICPYYGIYIVSSSNIEDMPHTLSGERAQDGNELIANLNTDEGHYDGATEFWKNKIIRHWDNIITEEMTNTTKRRLIREREEILRLYNKMTILLDPSTPTSHQIIREEELPEIKLSEIISIFCNGMGYDKIVIIDPSCDVCQYISKLKIAIHKTVSQRRNSSDRDSKRIKTEGGSKKMTKKRKIKRRKTQKRKR